MADLKKNDTLTGICNSALALAGHTKFIDDLSKDDPVAITCRLLIEQVAREVQSHEYGVWDELVAHEALVRKGPSSVTRRVLWNRPLSMLVPLGCYRKGSGERLQFEVENGFIVCNADKDVYLKYIRFSMNPAEWSTELRSLIIRLLSARLMCSVAKQIDAGRQLEQDFWQAYYPLMTASKRNKNTQNSYLGDDGLVTRNYHTRGQAWEDRY